MGTLANKLKKFLLLGGDIFFLYLSLWMALYFRYGFDFNHVRPTFSNPHFLPFSIIYVVWLLVFYIIGLYDFTLGSKAVNFIATLLRAILINVGIAVSFFYFIPYFGITPKTILFLNLLIFTALFLGWRQLFNRLIMSKALANNVLIIGQTKETKELMKIIDEHPQLGFRLKKIVEPKEIEIIFDLIECLVQNNIQTIITAIDPHKDVRLVQNLYHCLPLNIALYDLTAFYEKIAGKIPLDTIEEIWFLENLMQEKKKFYETIKRILDIFYSLVLGLASLPFFPFIVMAIKIDSPGPIFYKQKRVGENSQIFDLYKFRSMIKDAEKNGAQWAQKKDPRITKVGNFLRKTRLDELPQLFNLLKGDMSFVGPRPERPEFVFGANLQRQIPFYQIRHLIKPGLTGWAQINFKYTASIDDTLQKLEYDLFYIKNRSMILDLQIILKTVKIVLSGRGI